MLALQHRGSRIVLPVHADHFVLQKRAQASGELHTVGGQTSGLGRGPRGHAIQMCQNDQLCSKPVRVRIRVKSAHSASSGCD